MSDETRKTTPGKAAKTQVKLENAAEVPPPSRPPTCVTVGSLRDVLKGRSMEEFLREADEASRQEGKDES